jgi:hypothetical protein
MILCNWFKIASVFTATCNFLQKSSEGNEKYSSQLFYF